MRVVVAGGAGQLGRVIVRALRADGNEVTVLSRRSASSTDTIWWDGRTLGPWADALDGADVLINLAGRSVSCRYTKHNLREMLDSRVESTRVLGQAIARVCRPPAVWLQASTATIYAHTYGPPHDEASGVIGGGEPDVPRYWQTSVDIALAWERELYAAEAPATRKVALRTGFVMTNEPDGAFLLLAKLARWGLGGPIAGGEQFVSWIHQDDFVSALRFLIDRSDISGVVNVVSPTPLPHADLMAGLRQVVGTCFGIPASRALMEVAAWVHRTDSELILKSRRVAPARLSEAGFQFAFPVWAAAARDLLDQGRRAA
ncbi:MAG: DUF1731 domain-containing protein [Chloroflexota bacterium]